MQLAETMAALAEMGSEKTRAMMRKHGATELFGVSIADIKKLVKRIKVNHPLALELFATGNGDAMYLAGQIADPKQVTPEQLERWAQAATWSMVGEYMVAGLAAESPHGWELGLRWIEDPADHVRAIGWTTLCGVVSVRKDEELPLDALGALLERVREQLPHATNRTRYTMNSFVIAIGSYVVPLSDQAMAVARALGKVTVDMGDTACKVPAAPEYIQKVLDMGRLGRKKKQVRC